MLVFFRDNLTVQRITQVNDRPSSYFKKVNDSLHVKFVHKENKSYDFYEHELHLRVYTNEGSAIATGDINGDGNDDFIVGGAKGQSSSIFLGQDHGVFFKNSLAINKDKEVTALSLFDLDGDDDLDLYIGYGHNGSKSNDDLQDEIYINNGKGEFTLSRDALPEIKTVTSKVIAYDFDQDGDDDLFVASRVIPNHYLLVPKSHFLENRNGKLQDVSNFALPNDGKLGRIAAARLMQNQNSNVPLILFTGDWQGIHALSFDNDKFILHKDFVGSGNNGLWTSLEVNDLDGDGDMDIIAGNYGENTPFFASASHPFKMYYADLNGNNRPDPIIFNYLNEAYYPIHLRNNFLNQFQNKKKLFNRFYDYSKATYDDIFSNDERQKLNSLDVQTFKSTVFENVQNKFTPHILPPEVQFSPINATKVVSINDKKYIVAVGNDNVHEVFTGPKNASLGEMIEVVDNFNFKRVQMDKSGLLIPGAAKHIEEVKNNQAVILLISQNNDSLLVYELKK